MRYMKKEIFLYAALCVLIIVPWPSPAFSETASAPCVDIEDGLKECVTEGISFFGEDTTQSQARAMAMNNARVRALEEAVGVVLRGSTTLFNGDLINDLVTTATKGIIVEEEVLEKGIKEKGDTIVYRVLLKSRVKPLKSDKKRKLKIIKADVYDVTNPRATSSPVFTSGDEIQIKTKVNSEAFLTILSVDQNGRISKLYPNPYAESYLVPARKDFIFPTEGLRTMGIKLRVSTPGKLTKAFESVLVIATVDKPHFLEDSGEDPTLTDLMRELSEIDPSEWVQLTRGYEVRK